jgi:AcrR family transcriptional regulator
MKKMRLFCIARKQLFFIMQVQKVEVRDKILRIAQKRFYKQGFESTSTRQLAADVGMSVSNLYKYFRSKEEIFEAVVSAYHRGYVENFSRFIAHEGRDCFDEDSSSQLAQAIFQSIKSNPVVFVILMDKSKGTRYASFKDEIMAGLEEHIRMGVAEANSDDYIIKIFVRNFFYGIVEIAKSYRSDSWALRNIALLVSYHMAGISILYR